MLKGAVQEKSGRQGNNDQDRKGVQFLNRNGYTHPNSIVGEWRSSFAPPPGPTRQERTARILCTAAAAQSRINYNAAANKGDRHWEVFRVDMRVMAKGA